MVIVQEQLQVEQVEQVLQVVYLVPQQHIQVVVVQVNIQVLVEQVELEAVEKEHQELPQEQLTLVVVEAEDHLLQIVEQQAVQESLL
tara:strand:+ start:303 stop:563 length:261 start_codon:yes stop_codon:yes gene_type:complete